MEGGGKELGGVAGFLARLFIKNHKDVENVKVREQYGRLGGIVGIIVNVLLFAAKFTVGTLSGSVSVVADAVNNLSDAGSSIISLMSFKMAAKPADNTHPFGHARIEYISSSVVSVIIMFIGFELIKTSVIKLFILSQSISAILHSQCWHCQFLRSCGFSISTASSESVLIQ